MPDITASQIARQFVGARWRHQGRSRDRGIDCAGVVILTAKQLGVLPSDFDITGYLRAPNPEKFVGQFKRFLVEKPVPKMASDDVVLMHDNSYPCHCGILSIHPRYGTLSVIHSSAGLRKTVEEPLSSGVGRTITHCFEMRGI